MICGAASKVLACGVPAVVVCPLCRSERVRIFYEMNLLLVCACEACNAQFTVSPNPDTRRPADGDASATARSAP